MLIEIGGRCQKHTLRQCERGGLLLRTSVAMLAECGGQHTPSFETAALGSPASDEPTVGTALGEPSTVDCSSCCSLVASVATTVAIVAPRPANGARANVAEVVPGFFAGGSQVTGRASGAAANTSAEQWLFGWAAPTWQE